MATFTSPAFYTDNQYIKYCITVYETEVDIVNNRSKIGIQVLAWRTNTGYTTNYSGGCAIKIDGVEQASQYWDYGEKPVYYESWTDLYWKDYYYVNHDSNGTKTINLAASCWWYSNGNVYIDSPWQSFNCTLTAIDRTAPTVTMSISNIGVDRFSLSVSSGSTTCDQWGWSINNGATWTTFSTTAGTSASTTVTGLSPNTKYGVRARARSQYNHVYGMPDAQNITTIGNAVLNSVSTVTADNATVTIPINATVYVPSYTHKLEIKNGNTSVLTKTGITLANGSNTITLTSSERTTLLTYMANMKSFTGTFYLTTYNGSTQVGSTTSKTATVQTTSANSAPTFTAFTYTDSNSTITALTGNDQVLVQGYSTVQVSVTSAYAKNNATISSYSVSFGNLTATSSSTTISPSGVITSSGTVTLTVTAVDSRGYSNSRTTNVTVLPYSKIIYTGSTIRRQDGVGTTVQLSFDGTLRSLNVDGTEKNSVTYCQYRVKKTSDSTWGAYTDILSGVTTSGTDFSYINSALTTLDANYSWNIEVLVKDALTQDTLSLVLAQGTPLVTFRPNKVGINIANPTEALDVGGNVKATKFIGDLQGNSDTATQATQDSDGNAINTTYYKSADLGSTTFKVTRGTSLSTSTSLYWASMLNSSSTGSPTLPTTGKWWHVLSMDWTGTDTNNWISQLAVATQDGNGVWWRRNNAGGTSISSSTWHRLAEGDANGYATIMSDKTNGTATYSNYGASAVNLSNITYLAVWNGYELRGMNKSQLPNNAVTQSASTSNSNDYEVILSGEANNTTKTQGVLKSSRFRSNPANGQTYWRDANRTRIYGEPNAGKFEGYNNSGGMNWSLRGDTGQIVCVYVTQGSSRKIKDNIKPIEDSDKVLQLQAVSFDYKDKNRGTDKRGFIAEDVAKVLPNVTTPETFDTPMGINYTELIPYLQDVVKKQEARISALEEQIQSLLNEKESNK